MVQSESILLTWLVQLSHTAGFHAAPHTQEESEEGGGFSSWQTTETVLVVTFKNLSFCIHKSTRGIIDCRELQVFNALHKLYWLTFQPLTDGPRRPRSERQLKSGFDLSRLCSDCLLIVWIEKKTREMRVLDASHSRRWFEMRFQSDFCRCTSVWALRLLKSDFLASVAVRQTGWAESTLQQAEPYGGQRRTAVSCMTTLWCDCLEDETMHLHFSRSRLGKLHP